MKVKHAEILISEFFKNYYYQQFFINYLDGDIDPYRPQDWNLEKWGAFDFYRLSMDRDGAEKMNATKAWGGKILNITEKDDSEFRILYINLDKYLMLVALLDFVGIKHESIEKFDPYKYPVFSELITRSN